MRLLSLLTLSLVVSAASLASTGCVGELEVLDPGVTAGSPDAGTGGGGNAAAKTFYATNVAPMMSAVRPKGACTVCHQGVDAANGPDFLGATAAVNYDTLIGSARLVNTVSPTASVLITRGDHTGDAWCTGLATPYAACTSDEVGMISQWIQMEGL